MPVDNALGATTSWIATLLLGPLAVAIAMLAIAGIGFALLGGRITAGRAARVVLGCFILFGAPAIAAGLMHLGAGEGRRVTQVIQPPAPVPVPRKPPQFDPYAGAAVPN